MQRLLPLVLLLVFVAPERSFSDEGTGEDRARCCCNVSTLRLYFPPEVSNVQGGVTRFIPEVARVFVDDVFVGDAIVNLHGQLPTLRFAQGQHTIRVEMSGNRKFESKLAFLGHGSTQILCVDFATKPTDANKADSKK